MEHQGSTNESNLPNTKISVCARVLMCPIVNAHECTCMEAREDNCGCCSASIIYLFLFETGSLQWAGTC